MLELILPAVAVLLLSLPLVKVFKGQVSKESAKLRLGLHVCGFFGTDSQNITSPLTGIFSHSAV